MLLFFFINIIAAAIVVNLILSIDLFLLLFFIFGMCSVCLGVSLRRNRFEMMKGFDKILFGFSYLAIMVFSLHLLFYVGVVIGRFFAFK